ncbi:MAG TPA: hypothetical protein VKU41_22600 [Polyangiaceae bacterium]|nr:hypothetical protein [Polyangiaceae bacterium]
MRGARLGVLAVCAGSFAATTATATEPVPAPPPVVATGAVGVVHIDAPEPVELQVSSGDGDWDVVCTSPCDRPMRLDRTYRIGGSGIRDSRTFRLDASGRTTLSVEPTSSGARTGAVVLTVVGGIALLPVAGVSALIAVGEVLGVILICPLAAAFETDKSKQSSEYGDCLGGIASTLAPAYTQPFVWIPGVAGAGVLTGGLVLLASTPRTQVRRAAATPQSLFHEPRSTLAGVRLPEPVVYPLVRMTF